MDSFNNHQISFQLPHAYKKKRVAVVAEGGGQRGIFTAGVLDAFQEQQFNPFELAIGTSSGAQNLVSYWLGEHGFARRAITELTTRADFYVPYRWLLSKNIIDLDSYFKYLEGSLEYKLAINKFDSIVQNRKLLITATDKSSCASVYLEPNSSTVVQCMKASSAVPMLYRDRVEIDGLELIDGGVADPVPVKKAYAMGATDIVVIRTVSNNGDSTGWRQQLHRTFRRRALPSIYSNMLHEHEKNYSASVQFIDNPPFDVNFYEIAPMNTLKSCTVGSTSQALVNDYAAGYQQGCESIQGILKMLNVEEDEKPVGSYDQYSPECQSTRQFAAF